MSKSQQEVHQNAEQADSSVDSEIVVILSITIDYYIIVYGESCDEIEEKNLILPRYMWKCKQSEYQDNLMKHKQLYMEHLVKTFPHKNHFDESDLGGKDTEKTFKIYIESALYETMLPKYNSIFRFSKLEIDTIQIDKLNEGLIIPYNYFAMYDM